MIHLLSAILFATGTAAATPPRVPNACQLFSVRDIARIQGEAFRTAKLTENEADGMQVSQCFYALPSFANSVSVELMRGKTRAFWVSHFSNAAKERDADEDRNRERTSEANSESRSLEAEEEHGNSAHKVSGVGDAAFWSGSARAGALYVLKGNTIVRVSIGGKGSEEEKIERSGKLAILALRKL